MSSLSTASEIALAKLALTELSAEELGGKSQTAVPLRPGTAVNKGRVGRYRA